MGEHSFEITCDDSKDVDLPELPPPGDDGDDADAGDDEDSVDFNDLWANAPKRRRRIQSIFGGAPSMAGFHDACLLYGSSINCYDSLVLFDYIVYGYLLMIITII